MIDVSLPESNVSSTDLADIFTKRPLLKDLFERYGTSSLSNYLQSNMKALTIPSSERLEEFLSCLTELLSARLPTQIIDEVVLQLRKYFFASTADHHGTIN